jgi:pimeloyl-ACP methyl ester carboxylesterase
MRLVHKSLWITIVVAVLSIMISLAKGFWGRSGLGAISQPALASVKRVLPHRIYHKIHLIVLVHGWLGNPSELGYLQSAIEKYSGEWNANKNIEDDHQLFYVYSILGNEGSTSDGIPAGGSRVAEEVNDLLADLAPFAASELSLSFVGHSLGGLYARYSLSQLQMEHVVDRDSNKVLQVRPRIFCTTASPHLGVGNHTYLPIPRAAEYLVASVMQPTGRDLFRFTDVIERLAVEPQFITPLSRFDTRVAYANAHSTDFQVPTATAAFLADTDSPHRKLEVDQEEQFVALVVETEQRQLEPLEVTEDSPLSSAQLAERLDAIGWKKVLFDMRDTLPSLSIPFVAGAAAAATPILATDKDVYTSAELLKEYASWSNLARIHFPMGHNILVANAKSETYAKMNAAGKPV